MERVTDEEKAHTLKGRFLSSLSGVGSGPPSSRKVRSVKNLSSPCSQKSGYQRSKERENVHAEVRDAREVRGNGADGFT